MIHGRLPAARFGRLIEKKNTAKTLPQRLCALKPAGCEQGFDCKRVRRQPLGGAKYYDEMRGMMVFFVRCPFSSNIFMVTDCFGPVPDLWEP